MESRLGVPGLRLRGSVWLHPSRVNDIDPVSSEITAGVPYMYSTGPFDRPWSGDRQPVEANCEPCVEGRSPGRQQ
jgi:hypothetical protein